MKKIFIILILSMSTIYTFSQDVYFSYDNCGNRILRLRVIKMISKDCADSLINSPNSSFKVEVFPNPTTGILHIQSDDPDKSTELKAAIYRLNGGECIKQFCIEKTVSQIDFSPFANGAYFLQIQNGKVIKTWKIIKN